MTVGVQWLLLLMGCYSAPLWADDFISQIKTEYQSVLEKSFILLPHRGSYFIPLNYNNSPNRDVYQSISTEAPFSERGEYNRHYEAEFQVSFAVLVDRDFLGSSYNIFAGYTQKSWWQIYNSDWSRQFRETNYNPELFARKLFDETPQWAGINLIAFDLGYMHQSNGQIQELSRSWDRLFVRAILNYQNILFIPTLWYRLPDGDGIDENPDTKEFIGHGELVLTYLYKKHQWDLKIIPGTEKQGVEVSHSYPIKRGLRLYEKIKYGYGHSLIDYDHSTESIGIGITLSNLFNQS